MDFCKYVLVLNVIGQEQHQDFIHTSQKKLSSSSLIPLPVS